MRSCTNYCLLLGSEKSRDRALLAASRCTSDPIALMLSNGHVNTHRFADLVLAGNPNNAEEAVAAVSAHERRAGAIPNSVIPLTEMSLQLAFVIAQRYGLPCLSAEVMAKARNKYNMKCAFRKRGLEVPRYRSFSTYEELLELADDLRFPVVIKPKSAGGSEGVVFVESPKAIERAFAHMSGAVRGYEKLYGISETSFQVEEYVDAPAEISIEVLNTPAGRRVLAMTDKDIGPLPYFTEIGHAMPSIHSGNARARSAAISACEAVGLDRGMAHVEMKLMADGRPILMEVNARPAGGCIMDMLESVTGTNPFEMHCRAFLDDNLAPDLAPIRGRAAIAFLKADPGIIASVVQPNVKEIAADVVRLHIWRRPGELSREMFDANTRDGSVEFYWPEDPATERATRHLEVAADMGRRYFAVDPLEKR